MAKSQETFNKKEKEKKRLQKRKEKEQRKEDRKANAKEGGSWEDMMAYVDENGNISAAPPDPTKKKKYQKGRHCHRNTTSGSILAGEFCQKGQSHLLQYIERIWVYQGFGEWRKHICSQ